VTSAHLAALLGVLLIAAPALAAARAPPSGNRSRTAATRRLALYRQCQLTPPGALFPYVPPNLFDGSQRALVDRASNYLSSLQSLTGDFVQIGLDGSRAVGKFYLQKPGKVRFEYEPPSPIKVTRMATMSSCSIVIWRRRISFYCRRIP
jgi:Outer membrane lipoprotein carrier protein LolA